MLQLPGQSRRVCMLGEQFQQELEPQTSPREEAREALSRHNSSWQKRQREDPSQPNESDSKRGKCLEKLHSALVELDGITRTTDLLKSRQHLSLQTVTRPATSLRHPEQKSVSEQVKNLQADLQECKEVFSQGLKRCGEISHARHLFARDCLALRKEWRLVLSPLSSSAPINLIGSSKDFISRTRIGKNDSIAIDCSYASAGDHYDERFFTKVNRHLPFIVRLGVSPHGAILKDVTDNDEKITDFCTLRFSLLYRSRSTGDWKCLACTTTNEAMKVTDKQPFGQTNGEAVDTVSHKNIKNILNYCRYAQHDQLCRRVFEYLSLEASGAVQSRIKSSFVVSNESHLDSCPSFESDEVNEVSDHNEDDIAKAFDKVFYSHLHVTAASLQRITLSLSDSVSVNISLVKQNVDAVHSKRNIYKHCLNKFAVHLESVVLSQFRTSRSTNTISHSIPKDVFRNRFPSMTSTHQNPESLLRVGQQLLQTLLWKVKLNKIVSVVPKNNKIHTSWIRSSDLTLPQSGVEGLVVCKNLDCITESNTTSSLQKQCSQMLLLRIHSTFVEVEDLTCQSVGVVEKFSNAELLRCFIDQWLCKT